MPPKNYLVSLFKIAAISSLILLVYSLITILIVAFIGGPPQSVAECFEILKENRMKGLLRLDILTVFVMPLYFILFYGLFEALQSIHKAASTISLLFVVVGVTLFLAAPSVFSYLSLSDKYFSATDDIERNIYRAAAEGIFAADIWNGTGPRIGGILVQTAATLLSILMLRSTNFPKITSITGIVTHGLDLLHIIAGFFLPALANGMMAVAGVLYLVWFPLIASSLFKLSDKFRIPNI